MKTTFFWLILSFSFLPVAGQVSVDKNRKKVDETGEYRTYPGMTVIARVQKQDQSFFEELVRELTVIPGLTQHYSLLPISSFHMTTHNIMTIREDKWETTQTSKKQDFEDLQCTLGSLAFEPLIKLNQIRVEKTIKIAVSIKKSQEEIIQNVGRLHGIEKGIPEFHITLGYLYQDISSEEHMKIKTAVKNAFKNVMKKFKVQEMKLEEPTLCSFRSMTEYQSWE